MVIVVVVLSYYFYWLYWISGGFGVVWLLGLFVMVFIILKICYKVWCYEVYEYEIDI